MAESFEGRLVAAAGEDSLKRGKQLLKSESMLCVCRQARGKVSATVLDGKERVEHVVVDTASNTSRCSCAESGKHDLCSHAVAVIMYLARFPSSARPDGVDDEPARYRGLKYEAFTELAAQSVTVPEAELLLVAESAFPHVPSKFEHSSLRVKLKSGNREYVGNLNNIRQLHFGKFLAASLKISQFSQQDRQIIRFLAINAEADAAKLSLDAEQTAEFFHCLVNFDNFTQAGRKVIIHREVAEPVMLYEHTPDGCQLRSALMVEGALLPLKSAKVITGRSGCWAGMDGEYWWVPASVDVAWLRSFLRTSEQGCDKDAARLLLSEQETLPVRLIRVSGGEPERKECQVLYSAVITQARSLELQLSFDYDGACYPPDQSGFGRSNGKFWRRDSDFERRCVDELLCFGFKETRVVAGRTVLVLENAEAIGMFVDVMIPEWQQTLRRIFLSSSLAALCAGGRGVPELQFSAVAVKSNPNNYHLEYALVSGKARFEWKEIYQLVKSNRRYIIFAGRIFRIDDKLSSFMAAVAGVIQPVGNEKYQVQLPRSAVPFWVSAASGIPAAVPPQFHAFNEMLNNPDMFSAAAVSPGGYPVHASLRGYQKAGMEWMRNMGDRGFNVILADEMGLGKTLQTLALLASRLDSDLPPAMVICPTSLVENWIRECKRFVPDLKPVAISGSRRKELWGKAMESHRLIVCSYALIKRDQELIAGKTFSYVILDEAQHIKNASTANAKSCKSVESLRRLVLTGTPLENSPEDLWSIFDFLHPEMLGSLNGFKKYYADINDNTDKRRNLAARVAPFILRRKKLDVCAELPAKHEQILLCDMDEAQHALYEEVRKLGRTEVRKAVTAGSPRISMDVLAILMRMRQICCHPALLPKELNTSVAESAKMDLLKELVMENIDSGHKMLLFSQFTSLLAIVREWCDTEGISYEYLDGSTKDRQERVDRFNSDDSIPLFLLSLKAGGTGLNLTSADTVILYDPWWNPAVESQAADRTHRIGQTRPVTSVKLVVKGTVEEKILELQSRKAEIFRNLLESPEAMADKLSLEELQFLFDL